MFQSPILKFHLVLCCHPGKLVEEEEGNFALWLSYILTGAGANLVSWLVLPRNAVSVGASGAVFGLFAVSVLVKVSLVFSVYAISVTYTSFLVFLLCHHVNLPTWCDIDVLGLEEDP